MSRTTPTTSHRVKSSGKQPALRMDGVRFVTGQSACLLEADFRHAALCDIDELKEFARFKAEEIRDHVGGEFLDLGVQVSDDGVVVAASILQGIFDVVEEA